MQIGSYDSKLLIGLNKEEFDFLGRGRVDVEFLGGRGGYLKLIPGEKFSPYILPKATKNTAARYSIFPPIAERFGSQRVLATKVGNSLIISSPDIAKPVTNTKHGKARRRHVNAKPQAMVIDQKAANKAWNTRRNKQRVGKVLPKAGLETLVESINAKKSATGDSMVFNVTPDGFLEVLVRFGR